MEQRGDEKRNAGGRQEGDERARSSVQFRALTIITSEKHYGSGFHILVPVLTGFHPPRAHDSAPGSQSIKDLFVLKEGRGVAKAGYV